MSHTACRCQERALLYRWGAGNCLLNQLRVKAGNVDTRCRSIWIKLVRSCRLAGMDDAYKCGKRIINQSHNPVQTSFSWDHLPQITWHTQIHTGTPFIIQWHFYKHSGCALRLIRGATVLSESENRRSYPVLARSCSRRSTSLTAPPSAQAELQNFAQLPAVAVWKLSMMASL